MGSKKPTRISPLTRLQHSSDSTQELWGTPEGHMSPAPSDILHLPGASVSMWLSLFTRGYGIWKHVELHLVVMRLGERMFHHLESGARDVRGPAKGRTVPTWTFPPKMPRVFPSGNAHATLALPPEKASQGRQLLWCGSVWEVQWQGRNSQTRQALATTLSHSSLMPVLLGAGQALRGGKKRGPWDDG